MKKIKLIAIGLITSVSLFAQIQQSPVAPQQSTFDKIKQRFSNEGMKVYLSQDSSHWLKATCLLQAQVRNNWNNPGSTVYGYSQGQTVDMGLRSLRFQLIGQLTDHVFIYTQFGMNNLNYLAARKQGTFFHDAVVEYKVWKKKKYLSIGTGLTSIGGPLRYSAPGVGSILMADLPIYQQTTADQTDQFGRKLGVYFKGQIGKFDYRLGVGKPMPVQTTSPIDTALSINSKFSPLPPKLQYQAYLKWHFFDIENNDVVYNTGTYLGKKRILTFGAGIQYQQKAMRYWDSTAIPVSGVQIISEIPTHLVSHDLLIAGVDIFYDSYINKEKGNSITTYGAWSYANYGQNYLRYIGIMNMATGNNNVPTNNKNSFGNAFPMMGTGNTEFVQVGYKFKNDLLKSHGTLQPYIGVQMSQFQSLQNTNMTVVDVGVNWLLSGYHKISVNYQSRPVYEQSVVTKNYVDIQSARRGLLYLQYQISF